MIRFCALFFALTSAACQPIDGTDFGSDPVDAFDPATVGDIMLTGGGWGVNTTPVLETSTPTPGEPLQLRVSGMAPGQAVAIFVGAFNPGASCGTALQAPLSGWFGPCLEVRNGRPFPVMLTADQDGEAYHEVTVPALVLGRTFAFEAITPALVPLSSGQVTATTVATATYCAWEFPAQYALTTVQGADDQLVGRITCSATGGDLEIDELVLRQQYDYGFDFFQGFGLQVGDASIDIASMDPNGDVRFDNINWVVEDGDTVTFEVTADFANFGSPWDYTLELELDSVEGTDGTTGDYVRWLGGPDDYVGIEVRNREDVWCSLSAASPTAQFLVPGADYAIGVWRCYGSYGDTVTGDWAFEFVGDVTMYESFRLSDGVVSHHVTGDSWIEFDHTNFRVPRDGYLEVILYGTPAQHALDGGVAETGDTVLAALVEVDGIGDASGAHITWTGWEPASAMTFTQAMVTAQRSSAVVGGYLFPGTLPVLGLNLSASPSADAIITHLEFEMEGHGAWRTCGNTPVLQESLGGIPVDGTWTAYTPTGQVCSGLTPVNRFTLVPDEIVIPAGAARAYELLLDASGVVEGDALQVILTEICWRAWGDDTVEVCLSQGSLPVYGPVFGN